MPIELHFPFFLQGYKVNKFLGEVNKSMACAGPQKMLAPLLSCRIKSLLLIAEKKKNINRSAGQLLVRVISINSR